MNVRKLDVGGVFFGLVALLVGGFYVLRNTFGLAIGDLYWDAIWPLLVLGLGLSVLLRAVGFSAHQKWMRGACERGSVR